MKSEASFPRRADAGLATDLTTKPADLMPVVPTVPYPALSPRSLAVPLPASSRTLVSSPNSKTGNFFSSLGRKASMSKKERPNPLAFTSSSSSSSSGGARLTKSPPTPTARPVLISNTTPSVPGGPRAAPNRALARAEHYGVAVLVQLVDGVRPQRAPAVAVHAPVVRVVRP
ncbi:hypothetical protein C8J57DRAFT_737445 [Mycena rebaudengoi]|nr:hypothetical protein C8J57DRAFT_737445 [Mycena rebaudengoi]